MQPHEDLVVGDGDVAGHVDEIAKEVSCLGVSVAAHPARKQSVEAAGDDEEDHGDVDLEADAGRPSAGGASDAAA